MDKVTLHTQALSPYGWGARLIACEKGLEVELAPAEVSTADYEALHPFRKMPVLRHGEVVIYESIAIANYLDEAFPGPVLRPADPVGRAHVLTWMSVTSNYLFPVMNGLVKAVYEPSAAVLTLTIEELTEALAGLMQKLEDALQPTGCLVGDALTLADSYLIPHLKTAALTPQGANEINSWPAVVAWMQKLEQRPAYDRANPLVLG